MNNKVYADRFNEQYNIVLDLMNSITTQMDVKTEKVDLCEGQHFNRDLCNIWSFIRYILIGDPCNKTDGALDEIRFILKDIINDNDIKNCALKAECQRALKLITIIVKTLECIDCNDKCEKLVGRLFCLIVRLILILLALISKIILILVVCNDYDAGCYDAQSGFCRCLIDSLSKELNDLCVLIDDFKCIVIEFEKCDHRCKSHGCEHVCHKSCGCR